MDNLTNRECCAGAMDAAKKPDLVVIGAGSAGFSAAIRASELGAHVALIGHGTIGGTCVNVGCVPSKALIRAAGALHHAHAANRFAGMTGHANLENWAALQAQKSALVSDLRGAKYEALLAEYETIRYVAGQARFTPTGIEVGGEIFSTERVVIATGASAGVPAIPGIAEVPYLTSTSALELDHLPASLLIIGGGVIGCELGQMFARFGVAVSIVCRSHLLPGFDAAIGEALALYMRDEGITILTGCSYTQLRRTESGVALDMSVNGEQRSVSAAEILIATGRCPNTGGLGLGAFGIALDSNGAIITDEFLASSRTGIYAAGDVIGRDQYVYMAAYGARLAVDNALNGHTRRYDSQAMPQVVFTDPQIASVGLSEAAAKMQGIDVRSVRLALSSLPRALAARDARGFIKLVAEAGTMRLLGAHVVAPEGADTIQTAVLAIKHGLTVTDLAETLFPYLTNVEGLKLASLGFQKDIAKLSCCAG